jgi:hypothetical protein
MSPVLPAGVPSCAGLTVGDEAGMSLVGAGLVVGVADGEAVGVGDETKTVDGV